jgi:hypothetical protein
VPRNLKRLKKAKEPNVSLEAHELTSSSDDVSDWTIKFSSLSCIYLYALVLPGADEEICRLGYGMYSVFEGCESF